MIRELLPAAADRLQAVSGSPRLDAELLLAHLLECDRSALIVRSRDSLAPQTCDDFERLLQRRRAGEPLAYLTGRREFWSLVLQVTPDVLVPRPETELLVEWGLACLAGRRAPRVADLGTGSGCIALAIASERPDAQVQAMDASPAAIAVAKDNARRLELERVSFEIATFAQFQSAPMDLVLANPPYVADGDPHLAALEHEPRTALVADDEGMADLRQIAGRALEWLVPGGWLLMEHGAGQGAAVREILAQAGLADVETRRDLAGLERTSGGRRPA